MPGKKLPIAADVLSKLADELPTPFHLYDERGIRENARVLNKAFSWMPSFIEYYALKAAPNPFLLEIMKEEGVGVDCSSLAELVLAKAVGVTGDALMFTSNNTPIEEYALAKELGGVINLDDITHVDYLHENLGMPEKISFRYNPGPLRKGNAIIGTPEEAKYGLTKDQLFAAYAKAASCGAKSFGLHTMVASNELNPEFFVETAEMLFGLVIELAEKGITISSINLGGGIGIPYTPEQEAIDLVELGEKIKQSYEKMLTAKGLSVSISMENGRMMTGPYGCLVTKAVHFKNTYKDYVGVDACMVNLMRPGMYGAYHHISVLGKEDAANSHTYDVVGSLCENNDKFAINRKLPEIEKDDYLVIHDTGAHGHAMGFQYNGKLRSAEYLLKEDGSVQEIRRAETLDDYFGTLSYPGLA
ncbi:UNVERIFIED_CONTAM: hypothetical protein GTU68_063434 [Idotea baltica]|nr:hypothetical protein [Idotea baltica]